MAGIMTQGNPTSNRLRRCAIAGAVLAGALAASAVAAIAAEPEATVPEGATVLHLADMADRELPHDRLRAQLRVDASGAEAKQVQAEINKRMASAVARAHAAAGVKIETGGYSVYEDRSANATRWHGSQTLSLTGSDFAQVLALAGDLQGDGLVTSAMVFELAPETARAAQDDLTTEALRRLRQRAERIAADLQMTVLRLGSVHVGNVGGNQPQFPVMMRAMASGVSSQAKMPDPVAEGGDARVEVSVDADVILMPSDQHAP
jgi:predicted secreted protein